MTTTIKTFSKMLSAFVLCAGLIMTSCETADPVDDNKDPENSENTETPDNIIVFADEVVKRSCVEAFDTDGDGEVSYDEAAAVKDLSNVPLRFKDDFLTFDEFQYFTNIKVIPRSFFNGCKYLKSIILPQSLTTIESAAFQNTGLTKIEFPEGLETIETYAFNHCSSLTEVYCKALTPPSGITVWTFNGCDKLAYIYVPMESVEAYRTNWVFNSDIIVGYNF